MGLKDLFGKKAKNKTDNEMYLDEKLEKGLITYEDAMDNFAQHVFSGCVKHLARRKEMFIARKKAQAESFANDIYMKRADALDATISDYFMMEIGYIDKNVGMKKRINTLSTTGTIGAAEMEHRLKLLMEKYGDGFDREAVADRCLKASVADKVMASEDASYVGLYRKVRLDVPSREDVLSFIDLCEVINSNIDAKKPVHNDNGFFFDEKGELLEEDLIANWPRPDMELFDKLSKREGKRLYERFADAPQAEKDEFLSYCIDNAVKDAMVYNECSDEVNCQSDDCVYAAFVRERMISDVSMLKDDVKRNLGEEMRDAFVVKCIEAADDEYKKAVRAIFTHASIWQEYLPDIQRMFDDKGRIIG